MRTFLERIQPMSNVHLPFVSVYQRMIDFVHTPAYASAIRNSVTGVLDKAKETEPNFMNFNDVEKLKFLSTNKNIVWNVYS